MRVNYDPMYIVRADAPVSGKVGVLSGGGSGHEPMHGGFVGMGMLDAACPGEVFTSPTPDQMYEATKAIDGGAGVLHIVKNYTGDVLNFEMAADLARADGIEVEAVVTNDDVAVQDSTWTAGRRGVGVTVLAEKIVGAAAEAGRPLAEVAGLCARVNAEGRSMGMALTSCIVPAAGTPDLRAGRRRDGDRHRHPRRARPRARAARARARGRAMLASPILDDLPFASGDDVLAFVNGMGGTPLLELYIVYNELRILLAERGVNVTRSLVGSYITSLEMAGCSITLLGSTTSSRACGTRRSRPPACAGAHERRGEPRRAVTSPPPRSHAGSATSRLVAERKDELTQLDQAIGDGDHGINMDRGMTAVVAALDASEPAMSPALAKAVAMTLISKVGGASGPLYGTLFLQFGSAAGTEPLTPLGGRGASRPAWPACARGGRRSRATRPWWTR